MTNYIYTVPAATPAHMVVYLQPRATPGQVQVRLDNPTIGTIDKIFTNTTGQDIIQAQPGASGFLFVDQVRSASRPRVDPNDPNAAFGIKVQGGTGGTLMIDETLNTNDTLIEVTASTANSATVQVTDSSNNVSFSRFGDGVDHLSIRTNDVVASDYYPDGGSFVRVPALNAAIELTVETGAGTYDAIWLGEPGSLTDASVLGASVHTGAGHCAVVLSADGDDNASATVDFGAGTGSGNGLGLGNSLDVNDLFATAHLAHTTGGSGPIVVDFVRVHAGSVIIDDASTIGELTVDPSLFERPGIGAATVAAASTILSFKVNAAGPCTASVQAQSTIGTFEVELRHSRPDRPLTSSLTPAAQ